MSRAWKDILVEGTELRLSQGGGGPVLVMLHGIGSDMSSFDGLTAHLPEDWTLIAWNAPGYRASRTLAKDWPTAGDYAGRLAAIADALDLPPFLLAGHSLGTLMAVAFARLHPDRVAGLILLACAQGHGAVPGRLGEKAKARHCGTPRIPRGPQRWTERLNEPKRRHGTHSTRQGTRMTEGEGGSGAKHEQRY